MAPVEFYRRRTEELLVKAGRAVDLDERSRLLAQAFTCHMKAVQADAAPELLSAANDPQVSPGSTIFRAPRPKT